MNFEENVIKSHLEMTERRGRIAFAAACAERLFPGYVAFCKLKNCGHVGHLRSALDSVWNFIISSTSIFADLDDITESVKILISGDESEWHFTQAAAEDAVTAVYYTLQCVKSGATQEAAWSARVAYEAIDDYVAHLDPSSGFDEQSIIDHELVQQELFRQRQDIEYINTLVPSYMILFHRSKESSKTFLPWYADYVE